MATSRGSGSDAMYGYIYETKNLVNGKKYIGQHRSTGFDSNYKGSGKLLQKAIDKYGWYNFSVRMLCPCFSKEELDSEEIFLISYFDAVSYEDYYNLAKGGSGNDYRSLEWRRKISLTNSGRIPVHKGLVIKYAKHENLADFLQKGWTRGLPEIAKSKMRVSRLGRKIHSEDHKQRLSEKFKSNNISKGIPKSEEWKSKMSTRMLGNQHTAGRIWINNGSESRLINPEDFSFYSKLGYSKGRLRRCS